MANPYELSDHQILELQRLAEKRRDDLKAEMQRLSRRYQMNPQFHARVYALAGALHLGRAVADEPAIKSDHLATLDVFAVLAAMNLDPKLKEPEN